MMLIKDMGKQSRLRKVRKDYKLGIYHKLNYQKKQKAIFLDRDGVINEIIKEPKNIDDLKIYPFSFSTLNTAPPF